MKFHGTWKARIQASGEFTFYHGNDDGIDFQLSNISVGADHNTDVFDLEQLVIIQLERGFKWKFGEIDGKCSKTNSSQESRESRDSTGSTQIFPKSSLIQTIDKTNLPRDSKESDQTRRDSVDSRKSILKSTQPTGSQTARRPSAREQLESLRKLSVASNFTQSR